MGEDLTILHKSLDQLNETHNNLLCRIVGVTDEYLRDQLTEEYINLVEDISATNEQIKYIENTLLDNLATEMTDGYLFDIANNYKICDAVLAIELEYNIKLDTKLHRLRIPQTIHQKRELFILGSIYKRSIILVDIFDEYIDDIGLFDDYWVIRTYKDGFVTSKYSD